MSPDAIFWLVLSFVECGKCKHDNRRVVLMTTGAFHSDFRTSGSVVEVLVSCT